MCVILNICNIFLKSDRTFYASLFLFDFPQFQVTVLVCHPHSHEQHPVSSPISLFENVICVAISLALLWKREVEFHHLIRADVDLISLFHSGVDKLRGNIIYSLGCNSLFNHSHSQPG